MENKYWILILTGIIILSCIGGFLTYKFTSERWYKYGYEEKECFIVEEKECPISINYVDSTIFLKNNYNDGYSDGYQTYKKYCDEYKEYHKEKINNCFEKCQYNIRIVGEDIYKSCLWKCLHYNYKFAKLTLASGFAEIKES